MFFSIVLFLGGLCLGSFLNVYMHRFIVSETEGRKENIFSPRRSYCPQCRASIVWYDNIPLISYLLLGGKCRFCRETISVSYPCVELLSASSAVFLYSFFQDRGIGFFLIALFFTFLLITITVVDIKVFLIPDAVSLGGLAIAFSLCFFSPSWYGVEDDLFFFSKVFLSVQKCFFGMLTGGLCCFAIRYCGTLAFKKEAMGFGDVKMMAMVCAFLGAKSFFWIIFMASLLGTAVSLPQMFIRGRKMSDEIPFGPYLACASFVFLCGKHLVGERWFFF